jgi:neutral ceramidase
MDILTMKFNLRSLPACLSIILLCAVSMLFAQTKNTEPATGRIFRAGAATSNITPKIGTSINGLFQDRLVQNIHDETHARCLVLDDGQSCLAIVVMDLCAASREMIDKAKARAHEATGIPTENMLISATHAHSVGTAASLFQSSPDPAYVAFLSDRAADAIIRAYRNRVPARIGWAVGHEPTQVFNRRWKMKPGTPMPNPFGGQDQVKMNPGVANPGLLEPAGPTDPDVPVISVQSLDSTPISVLANYSLHYVGGTPDNEISADYYGLFANRIGELLGAGKQAMPFVGIMSNGTSGDINNVNVAGEKSTPEAPYAHMRMVADIVAAEAYKAIVNIKYHDWVSVAAFQEEISLGVRKPDKKEIKRAQDIVSNAKGPVMMTSDEVYAKETLYLKDYPDHVPIILQAFRIGDLAITAIPNEVFAEIGLELKAKSPFKPTFNIELANGYNGYLPTPAQHKLGGYETWRARSSYLEVDAAPKITQTLFALLNKLHSSHTELSK